MSINNDYNDIEPVPEKKDGRQTGINFARYIGPAGCAIVLVFMIAVILTCITSGRDPIPGYEPPRSMDYYAQNPEELALELRENVLPELEGGVDAQVSGDTVTVTVRKDKFAVTRSAVLRYFDSALLEFAESPD
ncbi:MAG: hypothetical protein IJG63_05280 [Oscillospiraceae bacterium]|nr:hypothetical protein [Oscillospiraceae bacterium]